jgi:hypothetical protein
MLYDPKSGGFDDEKIATRWSGTPVHVAARRVNSKVLRRLLLYFLQEEGCINEQDGNGRTMLHLIANMQTRSIQASSDVLDCFSKPRHRVNVGILDDNGEAALHIDPKYCCSGILLLFHDEFHRDLDSEEPRWNPVIALVEAFATPINIRTAGRVMPLQLAFKMGFSRFV